MDGELNQSGVALALTLARYFKRGSLPCNKPSGSVLIRFQAGRYGQKTSLY